MVYLQQVLWIKELFFIKNKLHNYTQYFAINI